MHTHWVLKKLSLYRLNEKVKETSGKCPKPFLEAVEVRVNDLVQRESLLVGKDDCTPSSQCHLRISEVDV